MLLGVCLPVLPSSDTEQKIISYVSEKPDISFSRQSLRWWKIYPETFLHVLITELLCCGVHRTRFLYFFGYSSWRVSFIRRLRYLQIGHEYNKEGIRYRTDVCQPNSITFRLLSNECELKLVPPPQALPTRSLSAKRDITEPPQHTLRSWTKWCVHRRRWQAMIQCRPISMQWVCHVDPVWSLHRRMCGIQHQC